MDSFESLKQIILILGLTSLGFAILVPDQVRSKTSTHYLYTREGEAWPYGVIGNSWGSGVSYNNDVLYDNNMDNCLRTIESHGPQMEADQGWVGHDPSGLRDAACSGSQLVDIVVRQHQMGKVGDSPAMVVMTSGGNNANFGAIVDLYIYHSDPFKIMGPLMRTTQMGTGSVQEL